LFEIFETKRDAWKFEKKPKSLCNRNFIRAEFPQILK
jgi:hypothetical protein